jgi:hypothetical protein
VSRGVVGRDERITIRSADELQNLDNGAVLEMASAAVRVMGVDARGRLLPCTGFFISAHLLMTAGHCVDPRQTFGPGLVFEGTSTSAGAPMALMMHDAKLDFALAWVTDRGDAPATRVTMRGGEKEALVVWQYPTVLKTKAVSVTGCVVARSDSTRVIHRCDTSGGASGAPLTLRASGEVLGVHNHGCFAFLDSTEGCENYGTQMRTVAREVRARLATLRQYYPPAAEEAERAFAEQAVP